MDRRGVWFKPGDLDRGLIEGESRQEISHKDRPARQIVEIELFRPERDISEHSI